MIKEFANDPIVRLLTDDERKDQIFNEVNTIDAELIRIGREYRHRKSELIQKKNDLFRELKQLEELK